METLARLRAPTQDACDRHPTILRRMEIEAKLLAPDAAVLQQLAALPTLAGLRLALSLIHI